MRNSLHYRIVLGVAIGLLFSQAVARAQTVSPVIVEYHGNARGQFQVTNDTLYPLDVVLEPFSFDVDQNGRPSYHPLDPEIHVRLSATSFRLGAKQHYIVFYEASAEVLPAWFTIYATVMRADIHPDVRVAFQLPHTVYLLPRTTIQRGSVTVRPVKTAGGRLQVELDNQSGDFARVQEVEIQTDSGKVVLPGFPFFPHQHRMLTLDAGRARRAESVVVKFPRFKVEESFEDAGASP